jgi:hypothetical protein
MFRPKQVEQTNFRLPRLPKILDDVDLQFLMQQAGSRRGVTIELPFLSGASVYMLTVKFSEEINEPTWSYYRGDDDKAQLVWQHPTGDTNLVLNLCAGETGQGAVDYTSTGKSSETHEMAKHKQSQSYTPAEIEITNPGLSNSISGAPVGKTASLEGDLSNMQVPTLLQSISMSKMTGCLRLTNVSGVCSIWFEEGTPLHAETAEARGDQAIIESITLEEGEFHFYPNEKAPEQSVKRRVDSLLMEGVTLLDQHKFVKEQGLKPQMFIVRANDRLTEAEFEEAIRNNGAPINMDAQKQFYSLIDNGSTFLDILRRMPMIKIEWVPIMFNMLACKLVTLSETPPAGVHVVPVLNVPKFEIDRSSIQGVMRSLSRTETGIFNYPAFLFLLEQQFLQSGALGMPLSLIVFEMKLRQHDTCSPMPMQYLKDVLHRIHSAKRSFDVLGHFETFDFAMFLPNTQTKTAKVFGARLLEVLSADPVVPRQHGQVSLLMGIACAPEDTMELPVLLSAAREAKRRSAETGSPLYTCHELGQR